VDGDGHLALSLRSALQGCPDDVVVETPTLSIFLEPGTATLLHDKVLDARLPTRGRAKFLIVDRT
jgi:hypothetical protein